MRKKGIWNLCIFFGYALSLAALREVSVPHWFVSTGFRFGVFLLLPIEFWPAAILGDCAGSILYKANALDSGNLLWFAWGIVVPALIVPFVAYLLRLMRWNNPAMSYVHAGTMIIKASALLSLLLASANIVAFAAVGYGQGSAHMEGGPLKWFFIYFFGHYLGSMVVIPGLVTYQWVKHRKLTFLIDEFRHFRQASAVDTIFGATAIITLFIINVESSDRTVQLITDISMAFPTVMVAIRRGWVPAVALTCIANVALRLTLRHWYDQGVIESQIFLATAITGSLGLAMHVNEMQAKVNRYDREHNATIWLARQNLSWGDGIIRRAAIELEQQYKKIAEQSLVHADAQYTLSATAAADIRWSMGLSPAFQLPPAIEALQLDSLEASGLRAAMRFGPLANQLKAAGIYYSARFNTRANDLPSDMQRYIYRMSYEIAVELCHRFKPRRVSIKLRVLNHATRSVALRVKVWPGNKDVSKLPSRCQTLDEVRGFAKSFNGKVRDMTHLELPSITVFLRDS